VRRYAELQPVFAGPFRAVSVVASTSAPTAKLVMPTVVAMPAARDVAAWLQVEHWKFFRVIFAHITFLQSMVGLCSVVLNIFSFRPTHGEDMITRRAKKFRGKLLTL